MKIGFPHLPWKGALHEPTYLEYIQPAWKNKSVSDCAGALYFAGGFVDVCVDLNGHAT